MSNGFGNPVQLNLHSSLAIASALLAVHLLAAAAVLVSPLPLALRLAIVAGLALSLLRGLNRHALRRASDAVTALAIDSQGALELRCGEEAWRGARLVQATVLRRLVVLRLRGSGVPRGVVVAWDGAEREAFRRFRAALRSRNWEGSESCLWRRGRGPGSRG